MNDDKRQLRNLKRDIKRAGNRKRRHYLKDVDADPQDFDFGRNRSDVMNEPKAPAAGNGATCGEPDRGQGCP
jgi:hypothetical protein